MKKFLIIYSILLSQITSASMAYIPMETYETKKVKQLVEVCNLNIIQKKSINFAIKLAVDIFQTGNQFSMEKRRIHNRRSTPPPFQENQVNKQCDHNFSLIPGTLFNLIENKIYNEEIWNRSFSQDEVELIKKHYNDVQFELGTFTKALLLKTLGKKTDRLKLLQNNFDLTESRFLKQTSAQNEKPSTKYLEILLKLIKQDLPPDDYKKAKYDERLKKIKTHLSNLPVFRVLT